MRVHITNVYNVGGAASLAQHKVWECARTLGFQELSMFKYTSTGETPGELGTRLDGIISGIWHGDYIILQSPTWNVIQYELRFVRKVKAYPHTRLAIFIQDVIPVMFNSGEENMRRMIEVYNHADLIVVPSEKMYQYLKERGLKVEKYLVQKVWDYPVSMELSKNEFQRRLFFTGNPERFPFLYNWNFRTRLDLFTNQKVAEPGKQLQVYSYLNETALLSELSRGGFGLVWSSKEKNDYYYMNQPYKVGTYLAAGIPVIIEKQNAAAPFIEGHRLGFAVDSLQEADDLVQKISEEEYNRMLPQLQRNAYLIREGYYTKELLLDIVTGLTYDV